ncbi:MAG: transposase [Patescibacteria group bacterium]
MKDIYPNSKSRCSINLYTAFLLSCPTRVACTKLSNVYGGISHDSVNRFLEKSKFVPKQLFLEAKKLLKLNLVGGYISVDDTIIDKHHCKIEDNDLVQKHYSGKHKKVVKGVCLITLFYTDLNGKKTPINYRVFVKDKTASKNELIRDMLKEALSWNIKPAYVTSDSFYATKENLFWFKSKGFGICVGCTSKSLIIQKPKRVSGETFNSDYCTQQLSKTDIPREGKLLLHTTFGLVSMFRVNLKRSKDVKYYMVKEPGKGSDQEQNLVSIKNFKRLRSIHWNIELYHKILKNNCSIESFMVRTKSSVTTHIHCALRAFILLQLNKLKKVIRSEDELRIKLYGRICRLFLLAIHELNTLAFPVKLANSNELLKNREFW